MLRTSTLTRALALAALTLPLSAQTTFQGLGSAIQWLNVSDMSADGTAVVGTDGTGIYLWTTTNPTFTAIYTGTVYSASVSNGGSYIAATLADPNNGGLETAARWSSSTNTWTFLPGLGGVSGTSLSSSYDISADGSVVVGLGWLTPNRAHAFRWDAVNGTVDLGAQGGAANSSRPNVVSADGSTAAGWDEDPVTGQWRASRWNGGGQILLGSLDPFDPINGPSEAYGSTTDGAVIVGESSTGLSTGSGWPEQHAFRWDALSGLVDLGTCNVDPFGWGTHHTLPRGVSDDGRTVVGIAGTAGFFGGGMRPFIKRDGRSMVLLADELLALGVPEAATWFLVDVVGISADGRVLAGNGYNAFGSAEPFRIEFPPLSETYCVAKINSLGCTPTIYANGIASVSSSAVFDVGANNVLNNRAGLLYYGFAPFNAPFQGGTKCVAAPSVRTPLQNAGGSPSGNDCSGVYSYDFNALIQNGGIPALVVGAKVYGQYWTRDPQMPSTTGLTGGVSFTIFP